MATYNWLVTCGCGSPTEFNCNTCGEKLCGNCKEVHLQNNDTKHHSITEYANKLMPGIMSNPSCLDHDGKECICWCQTCGKAACMDCITKSHRGHEFTELETVLQEKRASLQEEMKNLEIYNLKEWQDLLTEARKVTSSFLDQVNGIERELERRAKEFHERVEEIFEKYKTELNELKTSNLAILHEQEKRVSDGLEKVKQEIKECEDRLRSGNMESLLEQEGAKDDKKDITTKITSATSLILSSSQIETKSLMDMFGQLTITQTNPAAENDGQSCIDTSNNTQNSSTTESTKKPSVPKVTQSTVEGHGRLVKATHEDNKVSSHDTTTLTKLPIHLIQKPLVQSEISTSTPYPSITCAGSNQAWVQTNYRRIQLVDQNGSVKDIIDINFDFNDMVLSPQGDILLTDNTNKSIKSISGDKTINTLCKLQWTPRSLCCLQSGEIVVTFRGEGRVVIFSMSGEVIKELDKRLFRKPHGVAQNKINSDLYISDNSAKKVFALDKDFKVRYEYTRQDRKFDPYGICTDIAGNILITDYFNDRVYILDKDGQFLQFLLTKKEKLSSPYSIDVDNEGNAWVGKWGWWSGSVKVVKYLQ